LKPRNSRRLMAQAMGSVLRQGDGGRPRPGVAVRVLRAIYGPGHGKSIGARAVAAVLRTGKMKRLRSGGSPPGMAPLDQGRDLTPEGHCPMANNGSPGEDTAPARAGTSR